MCDAQNMKSQNAHIKYYHQKKKDGQVTQGIIADFCVCNLENLSL